MCKPVHPTVNIVTHGCAVVPITLQKIVRRSVKSGTKCRFVYPMKHMSVDQVITHTTTLAPYTGLSSVRDYEQKEELSHVAVQTESDDATFST